MITTAGREASLQILTSGYTPAGPRTVILMGDGHDFGTDPSTVADISSGELVATNYARQLLAFDPPSTDASGVSSQQSQPLSFGLVGGAVDATVSGCYVFEDSGVDATSPVTACVQFVEAKTTDGTELILRPVSWVWSPTVF